MQKYNNEQLKELIGFFKILFSISSVIIISLVAYVFQNSSETNYNTVAYIFVIMIFIYILLGITSYIWKFIKQLGEKE
jgi:tryptophan-rich sensory protein